MERIQRGPNPLLPNWPLITGTTTEMGHFKPCPAHSTFPIPTSWRHLLLCSLHLQKTLPKGDPSTAVGPSSSHTLLLPPVWHHGPYPACPTTAKPQRGSERWTSITDNQRLGSLLGGTELWEREILQIGNTDCAAKAKLTGDENMCTSSMNLHLHIYMLPYTNMHLCSPVLQKM